ncbi:MAG: DUF951 domain-containing protein [Lachnospiraceae bacterium]|nr:DUF951 domain-containing protein [Lachnospiraceae bacterium]MBQ9593321.1 DUF951 domain-containing protein [Lachnospiraceae bacterium]MBR0153149.1 DUF951 domain-containing protein [Lachnospiraceae bacterium]
MDIQIGDVIRMKKKHPCGSSEWKVLRVGMDFRLECLGCGHQIMIPRRQAEKNLRGWTRDGADVRQGQAEAAGGKNPAAERGGTNS